MNRASADFVILAILFDIVWTHRDNLGWQLVVLKQQLSVFHQFELAVRRHFGSWNKNCIDYTSRRYNSADTILPLCMTFSKHNKSCAKRTSLSSDTNLRQWYLRMSSLHALVNPLLTLMFPVINFSLLHSWFWHLKHIWKDGLKKTYSNGSTNEITDCDICPLPICLERQL